jgi:hypothetical protein
MNAWVRVVSIGAITIVAYDVVASFASRGLGFRYANATYGSWIILFSVGYFAARATGSIRRAGTAAAIVGAVEATLGWWLSWTIGAAQLPPGTSSDVLVFAVAVTIFVVVVTAALIGVIAGVVGRRRVT